MQFYWFWVETYENGKIQCGSVSDFRFLTNWAQINQGYRICKLSTCTLLPSIFMTSSVIKNENWFWVQDQLYQSSNVLICRMSNQKDHLVFKQRNYFVVKKNKKNKKNVLIKWITKSSDDKNKVGHSRIGEGLRVRDIAWSTIPKWCDLTTYVSSILSQIFHGLLMFK